MKVIAGYRYYTSEEQDKWRKKHGVPPVHWSLKQWRNQRAESGSTPEEAIDKAYKWFRSKFSND